MSSGYFDQDAVSLTVRDDATCETPIDDEEEGARPCGKPSRFVVERSDGDQSYMPGESCEEHLAGTVSGMVDGDEHVRAVVSIRWDRPEVREVSANG